MCKKSLFKIRRFALLMMFFSAVGPTVCLAVLQNEGKLTGNVNKDEKIQKLRDVTPQVAKEVLKKDNVELGFNQDQTKDTQAYNIENFSDDEVPSLGPDCEND